MGERRRARENALQMLFQIDLTGSSPADVFAQFWSGQTAADSQRTFAEHLVCGVHAQRSDMDRWLADAAANWRVERMPVVDRNVLRMAVYEMLNDPETPPIVVIDEAVEIAKKYGSADSGGFINAVLDAVRQRIEERLLRPQ